MLSMVLALALVGAPPPPGQLGFYAGVKLRVSGQPRPAVERLLEVAREHPEDHFADDALLEAASILHRELYAPVEALAAYTQLAEGYPSSRHSIRAHTSRAELERYLSDAPGAVAALAAFLKVYYGPQSAPGKQATRWQDFLLAHPGFVGRGRVLVLLGHSYQQAGQREGAAAAYSQAVALPVAEPWLGRARRGLGDLALVTGDLERAASEYGAISPQSAVSRSALEASLGRQRDSQERRRLVAVIVLLIVGLLLILARPWRRWSALWPPPLEVRFLGVVLCVGIGLALAQPGAGWALFPMTTVGVAAVLYMWLVPGILEEQILPAGARWVLPLAALLLLSGLCFLALSGRGLDAELMETIKRGPQR